MAYQIYLVDDHPVVRRGYAAIINRDRDLEVCGTAGSGLHALQDISGCSPDLALVDVTMEDMSGIDLVKRLGSEYQDLRMLVISVHDEEVYAERALTAGADGYLMKEESDSTLLQAIHTVLGGEAYVSDSIMKKMLLQRLGRGSGDCSPLEQLSDRELEVFEHMGRGLSTREIAEAMFISPKTVGTHRRHIKEKLSIETNAQLQKQAVLWLEEEA